MCPKTPAQPLTVVPGLQVLPPSRLREHWLRIGYCWQKYAATGPDEPSGAAPANGPTPTVGWSTTPVQGSAGAQLSPSSCVRDITAHEPSSPPARVTPLAGSVARIGSTFTNEYGDDASVQLTDGGCERLSNRS